MVGAGLRADHVRSVSASNAPCRAPIERQTGKGLDLVSDELNATAIIPRQRDQYLSAIVVAHKVRRRADDLSVFSMSALNSSSSRLNVKRLASSAPQRASKSLLWSVAISSGSTDQKRCPPRPIAPWVTAWARATLCGLGAPPANATGGENVKHDKNAPRE